MRKPVRRGAWWYEVLAKPVVTQHTESERMWVIDLPFPSLMCESEVTQSCPTLQDPMDCSPPGSSVHGIFQTRVLEWVVSAFSK